MKKDQSSGHEEAGAAAAASSSSSAPLSSMREGLLAALGAAGLGGDAATVFADAALVLGATTRGRPVGELELGYEAPSAAAAAAAGTLPRQDAARGSVESHRAEAGTALGAVESLASCTARLEAAMVVATAGQAASTGALLLGEKDLADPGELDASGRRRWRAATKRRTWGEIAPAIGWTAGESTHLVGLATAPVAFSGPVVAQMGRGQLSWRLARALWRACQGLAAADAAHVALVMCADEADSCVPERLEPDGSVTSAPWGHRAFWVALEREVAKVKGAEDGPDAEEERAAREAAFAARCVIAKAGEDGMGSLTVLMPLYWVGVIKDRLVGAADAARAAGDERTLHQLQSDIARALLAHATLGVGDLPVPDVPAGQEVTPEDLARAGWSPELIAALSGLPPAVLQVIVPLIGLHDPATADTLPTTGRASTRPDPNSPPQGQQDPGHTRADGCPGCVPSRRTARPGQPAHDEEDRPTQDCGCGADVGRETPGDRGEDSACGEDRACGDGSVCVEDCARGENCACGGDSAGGDDCAPGVRASAGRRLWVGQMLGSFGGFLSPTQVRELALSPGTTMARLLVDPADGRCVERSRATYLMDAAMRAQLIAADVTCRAPGCDHAGHRCQVDHVEEYSAGGATSEANGQLLHTGHHDPKTAKAWDAYLWRNRDVTWTSLLGRIYRTRAWDYRRYVTLLTEAVENVASAAPEDFLDVLNQEVYLALTFRDLGEQLNVGDDEVEPDISQFGGWGLIGLTHTDPATGQRAAGPSKGAAATATARWATATSAPDAGEPGGSDAGPGPDAGPDDAGPGDAGPEDAGHDDAGLGDAGPDRAGLGDAGPDDAGPGDAGRDAGGHDDAGPDADVEADPDVAPDDRPLLGSASAPEQARNPRQYAPDELSTPPGWTHSGWASHIRRRTDAGEDCPPF